MRQWIKLTDEQPDDGVNCLVFSIKYNRCMFFAIYNKEEYTFEMGGLSMKASDIDYWMVAPELPE